MQELLRYANYAKVASELGVTRQTVGRWARGESVPSWAVQQVERLIVGERKEAAPPEWARRLVEEVLDRMDGLATRLESRLLEELRESVASDLRVSERLDAAAQRVSGSQRQTKPRQRTGDKAG